jgi:hypothetical protein
MTTAISLRRALLDEHTALERSLDEIVFLRSCATGADERRLGHHQSAYAERISTLWSRYRELTPVLDLMRCPHSGEVLHYSIDTIDLDGLWWNYLTPARRRVPVPPTYFALNGAVRLTAPPTPAPFLCKPGPEVPYVVPRILEHPALRAVLATLTVGPHKAYAIGYFADPMPYRLPRANDWGTNDYWFRDAAGDELWNTLEENEAEFDFDLAPWITRKKLAWIAPGDGSLQLRTDTADCPYLHMTGRRTVSRVQDGLVWTTDRPLTRQT